MRISKKIGLSTIVLVALAAAAQAQIIGIDFNDGGATNQSPGSTAVAGPVPTAGWYNNVDVSTAPGPISGLLDNTNTATTATFGFTQGGNTLSGNPIYNSGYGAVGAANGALTPDQQLFNGAAYAANAGFSQEVNLSNIPYSQFDVYLLVQAIPGGSFVSGYGSVQIFNGSTVGGAGTSYWFSSENASFGSPVPTPFTGSYVQAIGTTGTGDATPNANYVEFTGLAGGAGTSYSFDLTSPAVSYNNGALIDAIEIVDAVPEPSTYAMMLGGFGMLLGMQKFRNRKS